MRRPSRICLPCVLSVFATAHLAAQDLEAIGRGKPLSFSGGISFNQIYYNSRGIAARRDPYSYYASGTINLSLYGWTVPFSFNVSNYNSGFSQPFNQYAVHPKWKWITAHAGYTSMSFSPYTVNGHIFEGVGVDLDPGENWHFSALYGRFMKAVEANPEGSTLPAFHRTGYAFKTTYGNGNDAVGMTLFHASDDQHSIAAPHDSLRVTPQENVVFSISGSKTILTHFALKAEIAASALTRDMRAELTESNHLMARVFPFLSTRLSTSFYKALKTSFEFQRDGWTLGTGYERIDPGYQTLGAYYFNNDLENITLNSTASFMKGMLTVSASAGSQRDNIDGEKISTMRRIVSACNITYTPSSKTNISGSWSTFQTFTNIRSRFDDLSHLTPYDNLDTLNFTQVSKNASVSAAYTPDVGPGKRQHLTLNFSWQQSADEHGQTQPLPRTAFYNLSAAYTLSCPPRNLAVSFTFIASLMTGPLIGTRTMGPTASVTKSFFKRKLRTSASFSWNKMQRNDSDASSMLNARFTGALSIHGKHNFTFNAVMVNRSPSSLEFTATAGYQYSLGKQNE